MGRLLKYVMYAIFLALVPAIYLYLYGLPSLVDSASIPEKPKEAVAPVAIASTDEELDHRVAQRLGSLEGWRAFLAAHPNGAYAQSARAEVARRLGAESASAEAPVPAPASGSTERGFGIVQGLGLLASYAQSATAKVERLLPADKASAPAAADGGSPDAKAVGEATRPAPPSPATKVAALTADEVCKRDGERLARLRSSPSSDEAGRFANELGCEKLRPQLLGLMESLGHAVPAPAAADGGSPDAKAVGEATRPAPPSPATKVAALTADEVCKRDGERLARLRSSPSSDEAGRFANELGCEKLRPQLLGLMESLGHAVPAPAAADGGSPDAKAVGEATRPAPPSPATKVAALTADEVCKRDGERLARLRSSPSSDEAGRFANELGCEKLRPQLLGLMESLGHAVPAPAAADGGSPDAKAVGEATRPAPPSPATKVAALTADEVCKRDGERLARLRSSPSSDEAGRFANELGCEKLRPQLLGLMESLGHAVPAPAAADGGSPDAKAVGEATRPAPPSPATKVANASSVVAANNAAPPLEQTSAKDNAVRGVSDKEILFGMAAPFTGASRELGRQMKIGVETAFSQINYAGGVNGRVLRLIAADDGYEPTRTADVMQVLYDKDQVFGFIGNVGTPTAAVALPFALDHRALFFGAFTGAGLLRRDPPDRYVFNYRASYAEETDAVVRYLVKVRRIQPKEIVVFAQQDLYGDSGYAGVQKAVRSLPGENPDIVRLNYKRNTVDVQDAVNWLRSFKGQIKAVVMVASYRAAAKFIEKTRDLYPSMIYTNVSFVGSTALTDELMLLGPRYATGVVVTQVVPAINSYASIVLKYKEALAKYFPGEPPDYVSFEGYIDANILAEAVKRVGRDMNTEKLVDELERMHDFDLGLGTPVTFSSNEHQGSHKVWGTQLDETGHYQPIDLR